MRLHDPLAPSAHSQEKKSLVAWATAGKKSQTPVMWKGGATSHLCPHARKTGRWHCCSDFPACSTALLCLAMQAPAEPQAPSSKSCPSNHCPLHSHAKPPSLPAWQSPSDWNSASPRVPGLSHSGRHCFSCGIHNFQTSLTVCYFKPHVEWLSGH